MAVKGLYFLENGKYQSWAGRWAMDWDPNERATAQVFCTLIDTDDGHILVDTGIDPDLAADTEVAPRDFDLIGFGQSGSFKMIMRKEDDVRERLKERGLAPKDIRYVVNTELHFDHVGANRFFTESQIVVHKWEYRYAMFPDDYYSRAYDRSLWDVPGLHYQLIEGDKYLVPGVTLLHSPGHSPGGLSVIVDCPRDGTIILAGDNVHVEHNYKDRVPLGADNNMDPRAVLHSIDRIRAMAERSNALVVPSHDLRFWQTKLNKEYH